MKHKDWYYLMQEVAQYIEYFILPNILAFAIARMYYNNMDIYDNFDTYYNTFKNLVNVTNENPIIVRNICFNILKSKYNLEIISTNPLVLKKHN